LTLAERNGLAPPVRRCAGFDSRYFPGLGYSPVTNVWVSLGYNFVGFRDDFSGTDYTAQGMFRKFRLRVDQFTLRNLWNEPK